MADLRRIITQYLDAEGSRRVEKNTGSDALFTPNPNTQTLYRATQVLWQTTVTLADGVTPYAFPAGCVFLFGIDNSFDPTHGDLITTLHADFNQAADWTGIDPTTGKICWRADLTAISLRDAFVAAGNQATLTATAYLWMTPSGEKPVLIAAWPITFNNIGVDPTTPTPTPGISYVTTDLLAADLAQVRAPTGGRFRLTTSGLFELWNPTQSKFQALTITGAAGSEIVAVSQGEA